MAREMKDSGIEWIGDIPDSWNTIKIKHTSWLKGRIGWQGLTASEYVDEGPYLVTGTDFLNGRINWSTCAHITDERFDEDSDIHIVEDDLLITKDGTIGKVAIAKNCPEKVSLNSGVLLIRNTGKYKYFDKYLYYVLLSDEFWRWYTLSQTGQSTIKHLYQAQFYNFEFTYPSYEEQERIASFLDSECARIDAVIEQTRSSIEEYRKLKQAVITQAVTKGIRSNRQMKDSGIEWIGEMPFDWELIPFRHVLHERIEKNSPVKSTERLSLSIDLGVTLYAEKTTNLDRFKDDFEQYKLAHAGDLVMNSMNMIVGASGVSAYYGCVSPAYYTFYDDTEDHITAKFCEFIFRSKTMLRVLFSLGKGIYAIVRGDDRVNTCRLKVSREDLRNIQIPVPCVNEQREIVAYLKQKCKAIDALIEKKEVLTQEIENYKKSLIFEYVTGKKEVSA